MFWLLIEFVELNRYPLACVQALRGGGGKESLKLRLWNWNVCIEKSMRNVDWRR